MMPLLEVDGLTIGVPVTILAVVAVWVGNQMFKAGSKTGETNVKLDRLEAHYTDLKTAIDGRDLRVSEQLKQQNEHIDSQFEHVDRQLGKLCDRVLRIEVTNEIKSKPAEQHQPFRQSHPPRLATDVN